MRQTKKTIENLQQEMKELIEENDKLLAPYGDDASEHSNSVGFSLRTPNILQPQAMPLMQLELLRVKRDKRNLQQNLKEIVVKINLKKPILEEQKCQYDLLLKEKNGLKGQLLQCQAERDRALFESRETRAEIHQLACGKRASAQQINKLSRQVQMLLSKHEKQSAANELEAHLTSFGSIQELHTKNMELQAIVDELAVRFEAEELRLRARIDELQAALDGVRHLLDPTDQKDTQDLVERSTMEIQDLKKR